MRAIRNRPLVAFIATLGLFGIAGISVSSTTGTTWTIFAMTLSVLGVLCLGVTLRRLTKLDHARLSLSLWIGFLALSICYVVGLDVVGSTVPFDQQVIVTVIVGCAWATLLGALASTIVLAFREFGETPGTSIETPDDQVFDRQSEH